jgi:HAD superfamily hydrolase (TIGR01549 family)
MTPQAKAAIFDLDGTLVCLPIDWEELFAEFRRVMHVDTVRPLVDTVARIDGKTRLKVFASWDKAEIAIFESSTACGEGIKLYKENVGKPKALVTLQGKAVVKLLLKKFGLSFDVVLTREDSLFRAKQLQMAAEKLNVPMKEVLFVGNADTDAAAAAQVGCMFQRV